MVAIVTTPCAAPSGRGQGGDVGLGGLETSQDLLGVLGEAAARQGQDGGAAAAVDQTHTELALEGGELLRDRRRRERQGPCGRGDSTVLGHGEQHLQPPHVQHESHATSPRAQLLLALPALRWSS